MKIIAVDLGKVRTGLAVCDPQEYLASPLQVVEERNGDRLMQTVARIAREQEAGHLVVGLPRNMDGSEGESAQNARLFAKRLEEETGLPVSLRDERGTTITAHHHLNQTNTRGKKRKAVVDAVAAVVILQDFLEQRRRERQPSAK